MARGPTQGEITRGTRTALQLIARVMGATYIGPAKGESIPWQGVLPYRVEKGAEWKLHCKLIRASNGEAALLFKATRGGEAGEWRAEYRAAFADLGVSVPT